MDNNNQINVQDIMKEIKKEIEVKGYTNDLLSFDDVIVDVGAMNVNKFDKVKFNEDLYVANHEWEVNPYRPLQGNKAAVFFKKVIRKLVYFFCRAYRNGTGWIQCFSCKTYESDGMLYR